MLLKPIFTSWLIKHSKSNLGFTLTEMLVGSFVAIIVTTSVLTAMVEILTTERQEGILTQTQQNMERALKYIASDIRQSAYVYDFTQTSGATPYPLVGLPSFGTYTPILAFWKVVPLTDTAMSGITTTYSSSSGLYSCNMNLSNTTYIPEGGPQDPNTSYLGECNALLYRRKMYDLVVYLQNTVTNSDGTSRSQILRYELPKYSPAATGFTATTLQRNTGFIDPSYTSNFTTWPLASTGTNLQNGTLPTTSATNPALLVDYVDNPSSTADPNLPTCNTSIGTITTLPLQTRIPSTAATSTSFFVCVTTVGTNTGWNQDVMIYLRGNADGQLGIKAIPGTNNTVLDPLETTVTIRGVINKAF